MFFQISMNAIIIQITARKMQTAQTQLVLINVNVLLDILEMVSIVQVHLENIYCNMI